MSDLVISTDQKGFTPQQVAVLRQLGVDRANDGDLSVFFHQCVRTGLDPFAKQIYMVGRWDSRANTNRYTIQTGIDGYRLIADRTGQYAGSDESWVEKDGRPTSSTVTVHKVVNGVVCNFTATAHWDEYVQTGKEGKPMGLWAKMPHRMLAKCAEALALRKAFPQDLSGLYTAEEMSQADNVPAPAQSPASAVLRPAMPAAPAPAKELKIEPTNIVDITTAPSVEERESSKAAHPSNYQQPVENPVERLMDIFDAEIVEDITPAKKTTGGGGNKKPSAAQVTLMNKLAEQRGVTANVLELASVSAGREIASIEDITSSEMFTFNNYLMKLPKEGK